VQECLDLFHWKQSFIRIVQDWEVEPLDCFFDLLLLFKNSLGEVDRMLWTLASSHGFTVKRYYKTLQLGECCSFPWKILWKFKVPLILLLMDSSKR
jgi:hypothetical protein